MTKPARPRACSARRGRSAVLWGVAAFAALQLGLAVTIECWWPELRDPDANYKVRRFCRRARASSPSTATVAMLGSSLTAFGLRGQQLEGRLAQDLGAPVVAFNLGSAGGGPVTELITLTRLLAQGVRPDLLLVEIFPPLLADQYPLPFEAHWLGANRLNHAELALVERYGFPGAEFRRTWWQSWPLPWYTHRFNLLSHVVPQWLPFGVRRDWFRTMDASGWVALPVLVRTPERHRQALEGARRQFAPYLDGFRLGGHACQALRDILTVCRREGIATALVRMPEGLDFQSLYPPTVSRQVRSFLAELSREYGAPLINARDWVPGEQNYSDGHHLVPDGAARFTAGLEREVLALLRAGKRVRKPALPR